MPVTLGVYGNVDALVLGGSVLTTVILRTTRCPESAGGVDDVMSSNNDVENVISCSEQEMASESYSPNRRSRATRSIGRRQRKRHEL